VARAARGPRGSEGPRNDLDGYDNLILLCANCHSIIDARPELFSRSNLLQMKSDHEQRIDRSRPPAPLKMTYGDRFADLKFIHVESGEALATAVAAASSYSHGTPPDLSSTQRALIGDFLQEAADWGDVHDCAGPKGHFEEVETLQGYLDELRRQQQIDPLPLGPQALEASLTPNSGTPHALSPPVIAPCPCSPRVPTHDVFPGHMTRALVGDVCALGAALIGYVTSLTSLETG
jgi:hypothetical protein